MIRLSLSLSNLSVMMASSMGEWVHSGKCPSAMPGLFGPFRLLVCTISTTLMIFTHVSTDPDYQGIPYCIIHSKMYYIVRSEVPITTKNPFCCIVLKFSFKFLVFWRKQKINSSSIST